MQKDKQYTLRFALTVRCNQQCKFCNPRGIRDFSGMLNEIEISEILDAAYENGIKKAHFIGGEPLMCDNLERIIANSIEKHPDFEFVFTSNGTKLHDYLKVFGGRVAQINFSLHSMTLEKQAILAGTDIETVKRQIANLKQAARVIPLVKLNAVALRTVNFAEIPEYFRFCQEYGIVLRMMELHPYSADEQPENYFRNNFVSRQELIDEFAKLGKLRTAQCRGDNFCVDYFFVGENKTQIGIMYFTSLGFKCPGEKCKSIFVDARGKTRACSSKNFPYYENLAGKDYFEKVRILATVIETKDKMRGGDIDYPTDHIPDYREGRGGIGVK